MLLHGALCLCIGVCTVMDILKRMIDIRVLFIFSLIIAVCAYIEKSLTIENFIVGICIGGVFFAVSILSNGAIGIGDAAVYMIIICFIGVQRGVFIILMSIMFAFFAALYLVIFKKKKKKYEMPFIPFIFVAYICCLLQ